MDPLAEVRIDRWLWAVRLYKTRSLAAAACKAGQVTIGGRSVKPARGVKINEVVSAKTGEIVRTVKVLGLLERRVGPSCVTRFLLDQTPPAEYEQQRARRLEPLFRRPKGAGRPTKKERRTLLHVQRQEGLGSPPGMG